MATAFMYSILAALLIAIHYTTAFRSDIHTKMTKAEKRAMFGSEEADAPYDVFPMSLTGMRRIQKSNESIKHTLHIFDEDITLNLKPTPQYLATKYTPVWSAVSDRHTNKKIHYKPLPTAMSDVGEFTMYQDVENAAALVVYTDPTKKIVIEGIISPRIVIRSLPQRLIEELLNDILGKLSNPMGGAITYGEDVGFYLAIMNVMFRAPPRPVPQYHFDVTRFKAGERENHKMQKRAKGNKGKGNVKKIVKIPKTVFPEMLIVLDHNVVGHRTTTKALRNILAFWNAMDLVYRTLEMPKIHLNIAGIIIAADNMATPYIAVGDLNSVLSNMGKHFYNERVRFPTMQYDVIIAMTAMHLPAGNSGSCENCESLAGYFTRMPICSSEPNIKRTKTLSNTMIIHYEGSFARQHLDFVEDDHGYGTNAYCGPENHHYPRDNNRRIKWPICSQKFYSLILATKDIECLRNKPLSMDGQCQNEGYSESCKLTKNIGTCVAKGCKAKGSKTCVRSKRVPLPGTTCGTNKYCNEKQVCVRKR